ncbi:uncharacterized protein EDB91DRAFT_1245448 [Suillus paluster]|uniref:uncharacterized protein n=1 Tax=Suillus paluster TaxID=48578 RepID=UPI001B860647|nr:uncharacterized protein EDB91DRAFT_1245448 [Suillus paluster]KAG1747996.1 hypothetical protein EDB91DRAFT_1245448 [Suillus paluster]
MTKDPKNDKGPVNTQQPAKAKCSPDGPKPTQLVFYPARWKSFLEDAKEECRTQHALENPFPAQVKDSPGSVSEALLAVLYQWDIAGKQFEPDYWPIHKPNMAKLLYEDLLTWHSELKKNVTAIASTMPGLVPPSNIPPQERASWVEGAATELKAGSKFLRDGTDEQFVCILNGLTKNGNRKSSPKFTAKEYRPTYTSALKSLQNIMEHPYHGPKLVEQLQSWAEAGWQGYALVSNKSSTLTVFIETGNPEDFVWYLKTQKKKPLCKPVKLGPSCVPYPSIDTLSLFVTFMAAHINPRSVDNYLSGICSILEEFYPEVRQNRCSRLVSRTLQGAKRWYGVPIRRKLPLSRADLESTLATIPQPPSHDDLLFIAQLFDGFYGLLQLGELIWPDNSSLQSFNKVTLHTSMVLADSHHSFVLRQHKSNVQFKGSTIIIQRTESADPHRAFLSYITSHNKLFPFNSFLWLRSDGSIPTRA